MAKSPTQLKIEIRGLGRVHRATAHLMQLWPEADAWDPERGVLELDLEIMQAAGDELSKFPQGVKRYRLADPFAAGLPLAEQINFLTRQMKGKKPVILIEPPGRRCNCGRQVSTPFCGSCGQQQYIVGEKNCETEDHVRIKGQARHCPFCGESIGEWAGIGRIGDRWLES